MVLKTGQITDEGLAKLRDLIGHELRVGWNFNTEATFDTIRHFAWGVGDDNPLWLDPEYGAGTPYGGQAAPPSFLHSVHPTFVQVGLPGVHGFHSGGDWKLSRPILSGDRIRVRAWLDDVVEKEGRFGGRFIFNHYRTVYFTDRDELIADVHAWSARVERSSASDRGKYAALEMKRWSEEEIAPVEAAAIAEVRRGDAPRFWEDVEPGEAVPEVVKGPLSLTDMIAWYAGAMVAYAPAHELALKYFQRHPAWGFRNPDTGVLEPTVRVHESMEAARGAGLPAPYDIGVQRHSWLFHALTNWAGDDGFVKACRAEYRLFNYWGDVTWIRGVVGERYIDEDGDHVVRLEMEAVNQRGEATMPGHAIIALPTRDGLNPIRQRIESHVSADAHIRRVRPDLIPLGS